MIKHTPDTKPAPDEVSSIEEASQFIAKEKKRILSQVRPLAAHLNMQWGMLTQKKKNDPK